MEEEEPPVIDFPRTEYYTIRKILMNNGEPAKLSECRLSLGQFLATLIFNYCPDGLSAKFGLDNPLIGPNNKDLWCSPSDLLEQKVCLKPPLTRKYIQALTHEGIIEMGWQIEKKFYKEMEAEKEQSLAAQKAQFNEDFDTQLRQSLKDYEVQSRMECERKMNNLADEFEIQLLQELERFECKLRNEFERERAKLLAEHQNEIDDSIAQAIRKTVKDLSEKFIHQLTLQKYRLTKEFEYEMQKAEVRKQFNLKRRDAHCAEALKQLEHNLECRNIANMMYVICMERRKCVKEREQLINTHHEEMEALKISSEKKNERIKSLINENKEKTKQLQLKTAAVTHLIRQFQKFIAFALKAVPKQAEFLLSVDKMLLFELNDALKDAKVEKRKLEPQIIPWKFGDTPAASEANEGGLIIHDFHDCLNEVDVPLKPKEEPEFLPAFNYKNNLYIRQDFRNMLSQGLQMKEDNQLWSKDVEEVIKKIEKLPEKKESFRVIEPSSSKISVRFLGKTQTGVVKSDSSSVKHQKPLLKNLSDLENINFMDFIDGNSTKLSILGSRNSLEIIRKKFGHDSPSTINSVEPPTAETKEAAKESDRLYKEYHKHATKAEPVMTTAEKLSLSKTLSSSPASSQESITDDRAPSRLTLARDSLVLHRNSILKKQSNLFLVSPKDSLSLNAEKLIMSRPLQQSSTCLHPVRLTQARDSVEMIREIESDGRVAGKCLSKKACNTCNEDDETDDKLAEIIQAAIDVHRKQGIDSLHKNLHQLSTSDRGSKRVSLMPTSSTVSFAKTPTTVFEPKVEYEAKEEKDSKIKKDVKVNKSKTKKQKPKKPKRRKMPNFVKVVGDENDRSGAQDPDIFTRERIHSLVSIMKEYPDLISLFTAGVR